MPFYDLDEQVVSSEGKSINQIFTDEGEEYFRLAEKDMLHIITESHDNFIMACGGGAPCYFNNIDYMKSKGLTIWINTSIETLFNRLLNDREKRPLLNTLNDDQLKSYIIKKFSDRKIYYQQAGIIVDDEGISLEEFIKKIFHE